MATTPPSNQINAFILAFGRIHEVEREPPGDF